MSYGGGVSDLSTLWGAILTLFDSMAAAVAATAGAMEGDNKEAMEGDKEEVMVAPLQATVALVCLVASAQVPLKALPLAQTPST